MTPGCSPADSRPKRTRQSGRCQWDGLCRRRAEFNLGYVIAVGPIALIQAFILLTVLLASVVLRQSVGERE